MRRAPRFKLLRQVFGDRRIRVCRQTVGIGRGVWSCNAARSEGIEVRECEEGLPFANRVLV